ncbi:MAG TPA: A/G-specific adenine glycosylase [Terriglobales bacterium]|nr:A/G-specific adenine glycosylase [Terriglobales bacterium]
MNHSANKKSKPAALHKPIQAVRFRRALLTWYDAHQRDLPWRGEPDAYKIWVSEIMLQQTRVAVVLDRYSRFLSRFPSLRALAAARVTSVLVEWSGLGYYRRARALHAAAEMVVREHGGKLPRSVEALRSLPGIGRYTAAAIASIAFGEAVPVVDGNVERVLQRFCGLNSIQVNEDYWRYAGELLDDRRPGDFNQAMMELGATVCLPQAPLCPQCPVAQLCRGRAQFSGTRKLRAERTESRKKVRTAYRVLLHQSCVLLVQRRPDATLMPSMWELPQRAGDIPASSAAASSVRLRHSITNTDFEITAHLERAGAKREVVGDSTKWVHVQRLNRLPLTGLARKILRRFSLLD